ncbi:hypothetical protein Tco_1220175 [Tanacetum coccineum]
MKELWSNEGVCPTGLYKDPVPHLWVSSVLFVKKKRRNHSDVPFAFLDYLDIKQTTGEERYPIPKIDDLYRSLNRVECLLEDRPKVRSDPLKIGQSPKTPGEAIVQLLKQKLCSAPILALPEGSEDFIAYCDVFKDRSWAAVLIGKEKR